MPGSPTGKASLRLFVALDMPAAAGAAIAGWQRLVFGDQPDLRINHSLHLTLAFLGQTPVTAVPGIEAALAAAPFKSFRVAVGDPIFLPEHGRKRVIALPLVDAAQQPGGREELLRLQADVSSRLAATGFYIPEKRRFLPHVTVARYRQPGPPFSLQNVNLPELCPSPLVLYTSDLSRGGAVHTPLATFTAR